MLGGEHDATRRCIIDVIEQSLPPSHILQAPQFEADPVNGFTLTMPVRIRVALELQNLQILTTK